MTLENRLSDKEAGRNIRFLFAQLRSGILGGAIVYRALVDTNLTEAVTQLKRGIDLPHQMRARLNNAVTKYGQQFVVDALLTGGDVTITELKDELTSLENYTQGLVDRRIGGETWEDICTDIEIKFPERTSDRWAFEVPTRTDVWGE